MNILGTLDDKIELSRQMNGTLEAMAQAIFKSWFVEFDPVTTQAAGGSPFGMEAPAAPLFATDFTDSELGQIPHGWRVSSVGDEYRLTMGQSPPGETYNVDGIGAIFYQGRTDFGFRFPAPRIFCSAPTRFADKDDTLVSVRAPVGDVNMAGEACAIGRGIAAIRHRTGSPSFTYYAMKNLRPDFEVFQSEGTLFGSLGRVQFERIRVLAPPPSVVGAFQLRAGSLDERIRANEDEAGMLTALRDALLPKLLSGEIRAREGEKVVEEAGA